MNADTAITKTREAIRRKHLALSTEENYCQWHSQLETTMGYLHAEALSVRSPLEAIGA